MLKKVAIGAQNFGDIIEKNCFYIDKTSFIKEWWESEDVVTLITRPRRFGKTLNMSMLEHFFSVKYENRGKLFEGLSIWQEPKYRKLQGSYPVISLSFARVKESNYSDTREKIREIIRNLYVEYSFVKNSQVMTESDRMYYDKILMGKGGNAEETSALYQLSDFLNRYYKKKVIILLDEYDTPMQEAYVGGYWDELVAFTRSLFNSTFKTNPYLERGLMTGITRVSKESVFSDLNNLKVITTTSDEYATAFGFTEEEVFFKLNEYGYCDRKSEIRQWYDGFIFGKQTHIYNPWSITNFLDTGIIAAYWANSSSNNLVAKLIREGSQNVKEEFEILLNRGVIRCSLDEQVVYDQLDSDETAIFSLLLASGYLKVIKKEKKTIAGKREMYDLTLTNAEVEDMFYDMVRGWFRKVGVEYNAFVNALLTGNLDAMNDYMNDLTEQMFSSFDTGTKCSRSQPERFYHGFVLGLLVDLADRYHITSNRESGFGRYDVMMEPLCEEDDAFVLEFKVFNKRKESSLDDTVRAAKAQIEEKHYVSNLIARGISPEKIRKYGFAFKGKKVLID